MPSLTVVVVAFNSNDVLNGLLDSLELALSGLDAQVVVVDNGSETSPQPLVSDRPRCHLVESVNDGYAAGINTGVAAAPISDAILVLNADTRLSTDSVTQMLRALEGPSIGIVAPRIVDEHGRVQLSLRREPTLLRAAGLGRTGHPLLAEYVAEGHCYEYAHAVDWALGAVLLFSRGCFDAVGGWDSTFFLYSEETDFCLRARDHGFLTWYAPNATAVHIGGHSGRTDATHVMQMTNRVRLYSRRHSPLAATGYYVLTVLGELTWWARGNRSSRAAVAALLRPSTRPPELGLGSDRLIPR